MDRATIDDLKGAVLELRSALQTSVVLRVVATTGSHPFARNMAW